VSERSEPADASPDTLILRAETAADLPEVLQLVEKAFGPESEEPRLVELIHRRGHARLGTVAQTDRLVGYVLATPLALDPGPGLPPVELSCLGIAPLAVLPEMQGMGIGSKLMWSLIEQAAGHDFGEAGSDADGGDAIDALFLLGGPGYYARFGFRPTHIGNEYGATDAFMALELTGGCLQRVVATARYVSEFAEAGM
jgi:putative acetyltransferase